MQLNPISYSFHDNNGQFYMCANGPNSPQKDSTVQTLQKIERYLGSDYDYSTDPKIKAQHPCPWAGFIRTQLGRYAIELQENFLLRQRSLQENTISFSSLKDRAVTYLTGEENQINTLISKIKNHLQLPSRILESKFIIEDWAKALGWKPHFGNQKAFLIGLKDFVEDLIAQGLIPSECNFYGNNPRSIYEETCYRDLKKTMDFTVRSALAATKNWIENVSGLLDKYIETEDKSKIIYLGLLYPLDYLKKGTVFERVLKAGKFKFFEELLDSKFSVRFTFTNHINSPLKLLLEKGYDRLATKLVAADGFGIHKQDEQGNNLLMYLLIPEECGFVTLEPSVIPVKVIILKLIQLGIDINCKNNNGLTPLDLARLHDFPEIESKLLIAGAIGLGKATTELHDACRRKDFGRMQFLINKGARIDARNSKGLTSLHEACLTGNYYAAKFLVDNGARVHANDYKGLTCLHLAVSKPEIVSLLVSKGANVHTVDDKVLNPFHYALIANANSADLMIDQAKTMDNVSSNYLDRPIKVGDAQVVKKLIDFGFKTNSLQFQLAVEHYIKFPTTSRLEIIRLLLETHVYIPIGNPVNNPDYVQGLQDPQVAALIKSHTQKVKLL